MEKDTKFLIIIALFILIIIIQFIPKFEVRIEDHRPLEEWICNCNCEYPQPKEEVNYSNIDFTWGYEIYYYNSTIWDYWYDECVIC